MKRPQLISKGSLQRLLQSGSDAWNRKEFSKYFEIMERAARLDPANPRILLEMGAAHGDRHDYAAAERCFEQAIRIAPHKSVALAAAGVKSSRFHDPQLAERYLRRAVEQKDVSADTIVSLAELFERLRRLIEAAELVDRALHIDSNSSSALLALARLERQAGRLETAESGARRLLQLPEPGAEPSQERDTRIKAWYELGAILDRQKRFDEAMAAFNQAKSMQRLHAGQALADLKFVRNRMQEMRDTVSEAMLHRWFDFGSQMQPSYRIALLCGHPRSGTTLLEQVLDSHPDIISAEETDIFRDDVFVPLELGYGESEPTIAALEAATNEILTKLRANYWHSIELSLGRPVGGRLLVDKNPILTLLIPALVRAFPEMKFLVALRDPRDVVLSCYMQAFVPLGQVGAACLSLHGAIAEYSAIMGMWQTTAPILKNPCLTVRYEDMVEDLETVAHNVLDFLRMPWDPRVLRFNEHAQQKVVRSPTYADVTKPVFRTAMGRWRNYQKYFEPHLDKLAPFIKEFGYE